MTQPILDKLGQEIKAGDYIAYGHALGRCAGLRIGRVVAPPKRVPHKWRDDEETFRITIWGVDQESIVEDWRGLLSKKSTLMFPDRLIVLDPEKVPQNIKNLYKDIPISGEPKPKREDDGPRCECCGKVSDELVMQMCPQCRD